MKLVNNPKYASFIPRFLASQIDGSILWLPLVVYFLIASNTSTPNQLASNLIALLAILLTTIIIRIFYHAYSLSKWGATPGKLAARLKVTNENNNLLTFKQALFREYIAKPINAYTAGISFFSVLFDPNHQAWHDHLTGSFVHKKSNRIVTALIIWISFIVIYLFLYYRIFVTITSNPLFTQFFSNFTFPPTF